MSANIPQFASPHAYLIMGGAWINANTSDASAITALVEGDGSNLKITFTQGDASEVYFATPGDFAIHREVQQRSTLLCVFTWLGVGARRPDNGTYKFRDIRDNPSAKIAPWGPGA